MLTTLTTALVALVASGQVTSGPTQAKPRSPYQKLFVIADGSGPSVKSPAAQPQLRVHRVAPPSRNVERGPCNMPVVIADAGVDPGILIIIPRDARPMMKAAQPPVCRQAP